MKNLIVEVKDSFSTPMDEVNSKVEILQGTILSTARSTADYNESEETQSRESQNIEKINERYTSATRELMNFIVKNKGERMTREEISNKVGYSSQVF